ncbi:hydrolase [Actinorhabdospora filicis]|uniref:Hydrolase n=1 Tax=Actinorhabdospora filicis TaxID=1785913 RepID=A0A9W6SHA2_9ACTN|nr:MBL fold metallo-hydrolase [Actinorhabdospora filicis]GLZ76263.1 hydrolase [Actinorhabdospora filicis]
MSHTELVLLGTAGGPTPKASRAAPAQAVLVGGAAYVIDCGNGVGRQLRLAGVPLDALRAVAITHHHSDHNADLGTLLHLAWCANLASPVDVYGPPPLERMVTDFLSYAHTDVRTRMADEGRPPLAPLIRPRELDAPGLVHEDDLVRISAVRVEHPPMDAWAYRIDTWDRSIVISGDTAPSRALIELARGADVLVHEVMRTESIGVLLSATNGSRLREHLVASHTEVGDVGRVAAEAGVGTLVLSHFVPGDAGIPNEVWRAEAAKDFPAERIVVGADLMRV